MTRLPQHLRRFTVVQDYGAYSPRDQAVWRHVLGRLVPHLTARAHESYLRGLAATGIGTEAIPRMDEMNEKLSRMGWSAVGVRGFVPPAVFTELQARRVLAIACDIRTHEHIAYTPAPDIIHESAGHAPILADPAYSRFLERAGEIGFRAIASREDAEVYESIRALSIVKEDPAATPGEAALAEERLRAARSARHSVSEATRASRLYWWTAEYGLVGSLAAPRIYGAGLLSSIDESTRCLSAEVERLPLDVRAAEVDFDITRMQPQLFVARELSELEEVVEALSGTLAFRRGGDYGLRVAQEARTVNHLVLDEGEEVSGTVLTSFPAPRGGGELATALALLGPPVLLSRSGHAAGPPREVPCLLAFGHARPPAEGGFRLVFESGLALEGRMRNGLANELRASLGSRELAVPSTALLLASSSLPSVGGGPADPEAWDERYGVSPQAHEDEARARAHRRVALAPELASLYLEVRGLREASTRDPARLRALEELARCFDGEWLLRSELEELEGAL